MLTPKSFQECVSSLPTGNMLGKDGLSTPPHEMGTVGSSMAKTCMSPQFESQEPLDLSKPKSSEVQAFTSGKYGFNNQNDPVGAQRLMNEIHHRNLGSSMLTPKSFQECLSSMPTVNMLGTDRLSTPPHEMGTVGSCMAKTCMSPQFECHETLDLSNPQCSEVQAFTSGEYGFYNQNDPAGAQRLMKEKHHSPAFDKKPPYSRVALITMAIDRSPGKKSTLSNICQFIVDTFPYYRQNQHRLKKSIQECLRINDCFVEVFETTYTQGKIKFWSVLPESLNMFENGNYKRCKKQFLSVENDAMRQCQKSNKISSDSSPSKSTQDMPLASAKIDVTKP